VYAGTSGLGYSYGLDAMHQQTESDRSPLKEQSAQKVYAGTSGLGYSYGLDSMNKQTASVGEVSGNEDDLGKAHIVTEGSTHKTEEGSLTYLEFFKDEGALDAKMKDLAAKLNYSIMLTDDQIFGKAIDEYSAQVIVPNSVVAASCHNPADCEVDDEMNEVCDTRFKSQPPPGTSQAELEKLSKPFCHNPPSSTTMVYALTNFHDGTSDWLMWACHIHHGSDMCHVTAKTVVDESYLASVRKSYQQSNNIMV